MFEADEIASQALFDEPAVEHVGQAVPAGPDQGVIEEARRRQRRRRQCFVLAGVGLALVIAALAWALGGGEHGATPGPTGSAGGARGVVVDASDSRAGSFNVRLVPTLAVAQAGWCVVAEEHGRVIGGGACGGVAQASSPFLQVYGWGAVGSGYETSIAVTAPQVAAVVVDGSVRVTPTAVPGLPYGLRAVRVIGRVHRAGRRFPEHTTIVALDSRGARIPESWPQTPRQGKVRAWRSPAHAPRGVCALRAGGVPGLAALGGQVATTMRPFPGALVGSAFVACVDAQYRLQGVPIDAEILLDAAHPGAPVARLPDWRPVPGAPGVFAEGGLLATRTNADAWLLVRQGSGRSQRMSLLHHLSATVGL